VKPLELNASQTAKLAELAPILEGKPDVTKMPKFIWNASPANFGRSRWPL